MIQLLLSMLLCFGIVYPQDLAAEREFAQTLNEERASRGIPLLVHHEQIAAGARYHAYDMSKDRYFDHNSFDREGEELVQVCKWYERLENFYPYESRGRAETNTYGATAQGAFGALMRSDPHREVMLSPNYTHFGVGTYNSLWVINFYNLDEAYHVHFPIFLEN